MLLDAYLDFSTPDVFGCHTFSLKRSPFYARPENVLHCQDAGANSRNERSMKSRSPALLTTAHDE
jgi:hypothetical protein